VVLVGEHKASEWPIFRFSAEAKVDAPEASLLEVRAIRQVLAGLVFSLERIDPRSDYFISVATKNDPVQFEVGVQHRERWSLHPDHLENDECRLGRIAGLLGIVAFLKSSGLADGGVVIGAAG
jgi:hypothetical protein